MNSKLLQIFNKLISDGYIANSSIGSIRKNAIFNRLLDSEIIEKERKGAGNIWKVQKKDALIQNKNHYFPNDIKEIDDSKGERYKNIRTTRNSKSKSRKSYRLFFLRSFSYFTLNGQEVILKNKKPIGGQLDTMVADKICFIENLENFMEEENFINKGWTLLYVNGRIGKELLERVEAKKVMHYGDLDYVGLDEYARIKEVLSHSILYVPQNYFEDVKKYSKSIDSEQKASNKLLELAKNDKLVAKVLDYLHKNNDYLEQEGYSDE